MPLVVRLDPELESGLRALSAEEHVPRADVVRTLIRARLATRAKRKTPWDIAVSIGVVGMDPDPRVDVAGNHSRYVKEALGVVESPV